ncbi:gag-polypeptide of LTR copia-type [Fragilaria crotonensis]|nr:gag-polypeptide of LTR copia-type [Fragilaria crotonensis]
MSENRKYLAKAAAWTYLVASCTDKAYALIERCDGDPFKAWAILQEKYCATDAEENYPELDQAFNDCKLDGTKKDPELWFNDMDHLNMRLARINLKYQKDDLQLKSHMMSAMSNDYESVIIKFRGDLQETSLAKLRKEIVLQYKTLVKTVGKSGSESVLNANVSKQPWRKFKGTCRNCGKIGHKANECRSSKVESTEVTTKGSGTPAGDKSHVTCYNCQQKGHFANKCTLPKKLKSDATADMAMFVGASFLDDPVDVNPTVADTIADSFSTFFDNSITFNDEDLTCDLVPFWGNERENIMVTTLEDDDVSIDTAVLSNDYVCAASPVGLTEEWLLDSGATCGVTYDNKLMTNLTPSNREITIGNGDKVATLGQGTVSLTDSHGQTIKLTDVYYAPAFTKHIVSMRKLIDDDWSFSVADKTAFIFTDPVTKGSVKFESERT